MTSLVVISLKQAKLILAISIAKKVRKLNNRIYMAHGSTNQLILNELGIKVDKYYNGYIEKTLIINNHKSDIIILNSEGKFPYDLTPEDVVIKGANALSYENEQYRVAVAVASPKGGTFGDVILKASCVGAKVIIPVTHEKLVPKLLVGKYNQNSFDKSDNISVTLFEYSYGEIYTEIDSFWDLFNLKAELYLAGGLNRFEGALTFVISGDKENINNLKSFLKDNDK